MAQVVQESLSPKVFSSSWNQKARRYVLFMDIMGFKDRVARHTHDEVYADMAQLSYNLASLFDDEEKIKFSMYSDSIVVYTHDDSDDVFQLLLSATAKFMQFCFTSETVIPIKGAIACGDMTIDESKQIFFGQPLIDAFLLEENLKFYGVVAHNSIEEKARENSLFCNAVINLKEGGRSAHYVLNCYYNSPIDLTQSIKDIRKEVSGAPRVYVDNSLAVIDEIKKHDECLEEKMP